MNRSIETRLGPTIYDRLKSVRMTEYERQAAITALVQGSLIADGCEWMARKIGDLGGLLFLRRTATR